MAANKSHQMELDETVPLFSVHQIVDAGVSDWTHLGDAVLFTRVNVS